MIIYAMFCAAFEPFLSTARPEGKNTLHTYTHTTSASKKKNIYLSRLSIFY